MTILSSELIAYAALTVDDTPSNGGRMSANSITSNVSQNVFPNALHAERIAGSTKYRKLFYKVVNDLDETLLSAKLWLDNETDADDYVVAFPGTQTDTQADIATPRLYGCANLSSDSLAGSSTIVVDVEDAAIVGIFADTDMIRITDKTTPTESANNEEFVTISGVPVVVGTQLTITIAETLVNDYTVLSGSRISSIMVAGDIACTFDSWVETTASGVYDETVYPLLLDNIGSVEENWTLTFSDASNFSVVGATVGAVGSGNITTDFIPDNTDFSKPYFTLEFGGFSGTWSGGDTITFTTHPAAFPLWEKRVIPAGAASLSGNQVTLAISGESA